MSKQSFNQIQQADITKVHLVAETLYQGVYYPPHDPRKESSIYVATHRRMIYTEDMPCWICKLKHSDYVKMKQSSKDGKIHVSRKNPLGAIQNETHHNIIEWAAANGIDWDKVRKDYPDLKSLEHVAHAWDLQYFHGHPKKGKIHYKKLDPTEFLDGVEQMKVLCDVHHRHPLFGIHAITGPIWQLQRYQKKGFDFLPAHLKDDMSKRIKAKRIPIHTAE